MIALIDYGAGNVRSVHKALQAAGAGAVGTGAVRTGAVRTDVIVTHDPEIVLIAEKVVLPGVGAFADCMRSLTRLGLVEPIRHVVASGTPFLGICVGMQVLFDYGEELGGSEGLGLLPGRVTRFTQRASLKVPHTGWNLVEPVVSTPCSTACPSTPGPTSTTAMSVGPRLRTPWHDGLRWRFRFRGGPG